MEYEVILSDKLALASLASLVVAGTTLIAGILFQHLWACVAGVVLLLLAMCIFWGFVVQANKGC